MWGFSVREKQIAHKLSKVFELSHYKQPQLQSILKGANQKHAGFILGFPIF